MPDLALRPPATWAEFASDETLAASFAPKQVLIDGVKMMAANAANKFLPPEKVITLPF
ncbi:MAG: hypothetical protein MUO62_06700 [Anaerolineales bacterium]|nr:hypothetical protein [Anaerolineales bacterium]